jgi:hypothetical protein
MTVIEFPCPCPEPCGWKHYRKVGLTITVDADGVDLEPVIEALREIPRNRAI